MPPKPVDTSSFTPEQLKAFDYANTLGTGVQTISSADLQGTPELQIPQVPPSRDFGGLASVNLENLLAQFNAPTQAEQTGSDLQNQILSLTQSLGGERQRQQTLETEAGLPAQRQELQSVINQLQGLSKEAQAIPLQIQQEFEGRGATVGGVQPIQAGRLRENAIKSLGLAAIGQTLQGNISLAEQTIQNALDAEFEPQRTELQVLQQSYLFNKDILERTDKKRADSLKILLDERSRILDMEENDKRYVSDLMLQAAQMGAPTSVLNQMYSSTPEGAIALGSKYLGAEFKQRAEQQAFENGIRTREITLREASLRIEERKNLIDLAKMGDKDAIAELGYDPNNISLTDDELRAFETQKINIEKDIQDLQSALDNNVGLNASTGLIRGKLSVAASGFVGGASGAGVGTLAGGPLGTAIGGVGGFTAGAAYTAQKRNSFMGTATYVVNNLRLEKVGELAAMGIKLNPISEAELRLMGEASKRLSALGDYDESGALLGFKGTANEVKTEFETVLEHYKKALAEINREMLLSDEELDEIKNL